MGEKERKGLSVIQITADASSTFIRKPVRQNTELPTDTSPEKRIGAADCLQFITHN